MGVFDTITATAVSMTVAGNAGVSPFLSLFLVGCIEKANPNLLNMGDQMESLVASWPSILFLGAATALEFVSMCIPVVDEIVDSIMTFVIPVISILGSLSTFGLYYIPDDREDVADYYNQGDRRLGMGSTALVMFQVIVVCIGVGLALCMHLFKMLVRLIGEGWLTGILTVLETTWTIFTILLAIFIKPIAIFVAAFICIAAVAGVRRHFFEKNDEQSQTATSQPMLAEEEPARESVDPETGNYVQMPDSETPDSEVKLK